tara:strand:- start:227 stop:514 length:288 start_codon:yes stop_codon:yes gene_type:complete
MKAIKTILDNLRTHQRWDDVWKETEKELKKREDSLAEEYAMYCLQEGIKTQEKLGVLKYDEKELLGILFDKEKAKAATQPLYTFREWYNKYKIEK